MLTLIMALMSTNSGLCVHYLMSRELPAFPAWMLSLLEGIVDVNVNVSCHFYTTVSEPFAGTHCAPEVKPITMSALVVGLGATPVYISVIS